VRESIAIATKDMEANPPKSEIAEERFSFKINQKVLVATLFTLIIFGTTYYWLDDRPDVYQPLWIIASAIWYVAIIAAIIFVRNKTRLGYLIAGILSWVTLAFWIFDNFHLPFTMSLLAEQPSQIMTIRNLIGIGLASLAVISSHNLFHKVINYQYKGKPI
jgi:hypothetical protein